MKMKKIALPLLSIVLLGAGLTSCKDKKVETKVVVTDSIAWNFQSSHHVFYSLSEGKEITLADSATAKWDIGFNLATIILNSHASGPGQAGVIVKTGNYESATSAPTEGYSYDTTAMQLAINSNPFSPNAWYVYDPVTHAFSPKAGQYFIVKTADGKYAKLEMISVIPVIDPGALYPKTLIYKFRYTYQSNGSVNFN